MFFDFIVTSALWLYFIGGFFLFFLLFYLLAYLFSKNRELSFQYLNHLFYKSFLRLTRWLAPRHRWQIDGDIAKIRSSVIVCNHVSYLDPLIIISLFPRHKTIVKTRFFHMPVFGWLMKTAGYLPSSTDDKFTFLMIEQVERMKEYLLKGGNLIIFPEGTRRSGKTGAFNNGAFKIARLCQAPIKVLRLNGSDKLFTPGKFLFNTRVRNKITVELIAGIEPDYLNAPPSVSELRNSVQKAFAAGR